MSSSNSSDANDVGSFNSTSSNSSDESSGDIVFTSAPKSVTSDTGDSCAWYSGGICSHPRSCYDCLNVVIPGENCAIGPYGICANSYVVEAVGGYPMDNFTYCSNSDAECAACRDNWTSDYDAGNFVDSSAMCVGEGGCICLAACESPNHDSIVIQNSCLPSLSGNQFRLVLGMMLATVMLFLLALFCTKKTIQRRDSRRQQQLEAAREARREARRPAASAHLPQLSLSGWTDMREKLVSTEQEMLGNSDTKPTLSRTTTEPPNVVVEEGDGYRPMSPNDQHPPRRVL
ncbi:hypothetical protein PHYBOEH_001053 [Phytophthora boehmeriae]|uniref:Uncharacterized protein n=1 Tax=Phytophthora boehmeriae TaxID=109152 RepID=A0A8T1WVV3_9STRA|nr:hypothetical protein PHYBOEH_001053 [Phytophthora boehmeriae]